VRPHRLILSALVALAAAAPLLAAGDLKERPFDAERAYRDLVRQCDFGPRVPGTDPHARCAQWLAGQLRACTDEVTLRNFTVQVRGKPLPITNIEAIFNPDGKRHILLCAHWDSRPTAERDPDPANHAKPIAGANDGASGVAVLLEVARALKAAPPNQRITIVLFDGEDYGPGLQDMFLGSRVFADQPHDPPFDWAILLDMVGDSDLRIAPERISVQEALWLVDKIWTAAEHAGCQAFDREKGPLVMDDHVLLLQRGIPCIVLIDFDYPYWHTLADTPDKCSPDSLAQVGRALLRAIAEDEAEHKPSRPSTTGP
jgi:Zn-dependent M28 family amino/carboxypeptidase